MKKIVCLLLTACLLLALAACGASEPAAETAEPAAEATPEPAAEAAPAPEPTPEPEPAAWTRQGYFTDENGNMLSVMWMEDIDVPGWYVGVMLGEYMGGSTLSQEGGSLRGDLNAWDESAEPFVVTVSEEGEDGLLLAVEDGESYHFTPYEMPTATIVVNVNTEGWGNIDYAEGEEAPEIDPEYPFQSAYIGLAEPAVHTFVAWPKAGNFFVKWTKNGEDFSTEPQITVLLDESADFVAVFEEDPDWQNPVMNFVGEYQCDRAHALVECFGADEAWITIEWGSSAWEMARWFIVDRLDTETLTISYSGGTKQIVVYDENGEIKSEDEEYNDGTGSVTFNEDGSFTWHEDQAEDREDMVFERLPVTDDPDYYSAVTAMEKSEVEDFCLMARSAYLDEDWAALAPVIRYPIVMRASGTETEIKTAEEFLNFMQDKTILDGDRAALAEETCRDMFFNGQGICLGSGQIWIIDPNYMTDEAPALLILAFNGITGK